MASQLTLTAKIGPAETVTALIFTNPTSINFNIAKNILTVNGQDYDITAATTVTCTKSGSNYTWVVS